VNIFQKLMVKPWLTNEGIEDTETIGFAMPTKKVTLRVFLAIVTVLFLLFLITLFQRSQYADWQSLAAEPGAPLWSPTTLYLNTFFLLLGSASFEVSKRFAWNGRLQGARFSLLLGGVFSFIFVAGQLWFWQQLSSWGYFIADNPATSFFYMLTGVHGLHMIGGLAVWSYTCFALFSGSRTVTDSRLGIELCTTYWHFLLLVWLVLFGLLSSPPETFEIIAAMCGMR